MKYRNNSKERGEERWKEGNGQRKTKRRDKEKIRGEEKEKKDRRKKKEGK